MKIILLNSFSLVRPIFGEPEAIYPPLGILYIASYLRKNGYNKIKVVDGGKIGMRKTLEIIKKEDFDILGISSTTWAAEGARYLIKYVKNVKDKKVPIIVGGPHATALPRYFLDAGADIVVKGEGEKTFFEIVKFLEEGGKLKNIRGIAFRKNRRYIETKPRELLDVNSLPSPARDLIDIKRYPGLYWSLAKPETHIISSRGCPFRCFFCSNPVWRQNVPFYRLRTPENIGEEVKELKYKYKIKELSDESDTFNVNLDWCINVAREIGKFGILWKAQLRADRVTRKLAYELKKSNCWLVRMGIESGNQETLDGVKKFINLQEVIRALRKLKEQNINTVGLFMGFNVWEKDGKLFFEDYKKTFKTLKFIKKLINEKLLDSFQFVLATPFPGSDLYYLAQKYNLIEIENFSYWNQSSYFIMRLPNVRREDIEKIKGIATLLQALTMIRFRKAINPKMLRYYYGKVLLILNYILRNMW